MAETVIRAANDVLLEELLAQLGDRPLARRLLIGEAVYRVAVDRVGLIWTVGEPAGHTADPARADRLRDAQERLVEARKENPSVGWNDIVLLPSEAEQLAHDLAHERRPPVKAPNGFDGAAQQLLDLSLLAPVRFADGDEEKFIVHRWTASALAQRCTEAEQIGAPASWVDTLFFQLPL